MSLPATATAAVLQAMKPLLVRQPVSKPLAEKVPDFPLGASPQLRRATDGHGCLGMKLQLALAQVSDVDFS